jgi:RHS repeat-associated protein
MTFQYDPEGRLASAVQPATGNGGAYAYDAFGLLSSRTVNQSGSPSTTTLYVYDLKGHVIAETDPSGATQREYIWMDDLPVAVVAGVNTANPTLYYVHADHLGRPARMTDQNQNWVWDVIYSPFGATSYIWTNPATLDLRFPGQWFQLETGLAYNWHRHYDPTIGRYLQPDPLGYGGGRNLYAYAKGNPFAYVDRDGRNPFLAAVAIGAITGAGTDLLIQLERQNWNFGCVRWSEVGASALLGALGGAALGGLSGLAVGGADALGAVVGTAGAAEGGLSAAEQLAANRAVGAAFEQAVGENLEQSGLTVGQQITVETQSGVRTRLDFLT